MKEIGAKRSISPVAVCVLRRLSDTLLLLSAFWLCPSGLFAQGSHSNTTNTAQGVNSNSTANGKGTHSNKDPQGAIVGSSNCGRAGQSACAPPAGYGVTVQPTLAGAEGGMPEGCTGSFGLGERERCTIVSVGQSPLSISVAPDGKSMTGQQTTLTVQYSDNPSSGCEKIYQIEVARPVIANTPAAVDIANQNVASNGTCAFTSTFPIQPFFTQELQGCASNHLTTQLHIILKSHNGLGNLTTDDGSDRLAQVSASIDCQKLTASAIAIAPTSFTGTCPAGVAATAKFHSNGAGPLTAVWTFADSRIAPVRASIQAAAGNNTIGTAPIRLGDSDSTTVALNISGPGGVASASAPFRVHCTKPPIAGASAALSSTLKVPVKAPVKLPSTSATRPNP